MKKRLSKAGMSLVELIIVMGILGILFTAVYMFFTKGTQQFHFTRMQNQLATTGRLALETISDEVRWAGYMPNGGWTEEQWHPVEVATDTRFEFYADMNDPEQQLTSDDYRNIYRTTADDLLHITDDGTMDRVAGDAIVALQFNYFDRDGDLLSKPLSTNDCDAVRHIGVKITLQGSYMGDVYQTAMQTMITPRNLGVQHNFDPLFYLPPETPAEILVNVADSSGVEAPTDHEIRLINLLLDWGHTVVILTDNQLAGFNYDSSSVDLVILRDIPGGTSSHVSIATSLQSIALPVIALDPDDAVDVFFMAARASYVTNGNCPMKKILSHTIHRYIPQSEPDPDTVSTFHIYAINTGTRTTVLDSLTVNTELITAFTGTGADTLSGVSAKFENEPAHRRIHFCAPDFLYLGEDGELFLYNVIQWGYRNLETTPPLGEEIVSEDFEGDSPGEILVTLWHDDLEGGSIMPDSVPLYSDFETGGTPGLLWINSSEGSGVITRLADNTLEMHRSISGTADRNISGTSLDLSAYSALSDDIYLVTDCWKGTSETIDSEDGVFLVSGGGTSTELVSEDFESLLLGNGDVEFWGDLYGRHRIHSPEPPWNNTTSFVTLDSREDANLARSRMMIEIDTSMLPDGTPITVTYRMTDHSDETHDFESSNNRGDYIGWSLGNSIDDTIEGHEDLDPGTKANGVWADYSYTFIPTGTMPSTLYVIFSQYGRKRAVSATLEDGISFDDVVVTANVGAGSLTRIGVPLSIADWQRISVDLDDQAVSNGVPFSTDFGLALSQNGMGSWDSYGMHWRDFEVGVIQQVYSIPGWAHGASAAGGIDDWTLEEISGGHRWTMHANNSTNYSNESDCWLETPVISVPAGATQAKLNLTHQLSLDTNSDFTWIEISTNNGATWQIFDTATYTSTYGGHGAYTGSIASSDLELSLDSYTGQSFKLRFVLHSDISVTQGGWQLDDFVATCLIEGLEIESIGFKPQIPAGTWYFNSVDVYLGGVADDHFTSSGEWNKSELVFAGTYTVQPNSSEEWVTINLNEHFILPASSNLLVKLEMEQASTSPGYVWVAEPCSDMSRWAVSGSGDPVTLAVADNKPAFKISTVYNGEKLVFQTGSTASAVMPLAFSSVFSDFEAIYTMAELGFSGEVSWVHGGQKDDWEIGAPVFTSVIDPALMPANENNVAGNDLTDDGYYNPMSWCWIRSSAYDLTEAAAYDSVAMSYDRCLRRSHNDLARIQFAFTTTQTAPTELSDWTDVKVCDYDDIDWETDIVQLTYYFDQAVADGNIYFFVRFVLDSGPFAEKGGWNIDNVGIFGRNGI